MFYAKEAPHNACLSWIILCYKFFVLYSTICGLSMYILWDFDLTRCGPVTSYDNKVNIGLGNGLLPEGTKPLASPVLTSHK